MNIPRVVDLVARLEEFGYFVTSAGGEGPERIVVAQRQPSDGPPDSLAQNRGKGRWELIVDDKALRAVLHATVKASKGRRAKIAEKDYWRALDSICFGIETLVDTSAPSRSPFHFVETHFESVSGDQMAPEADWPEGDWRATRLD